MGFKPKGFWAKASSKKPILQLKLVCKSSGQEFKLIFKSSLQPKGPGCGPCKGAHEANDLISSPEVLTEEGFGADPMSNAFSSVADSVMGLPEVGLGFFRRFNVMGSIR